MARFFKKSEENKGLAPGSLIFIGNKKMDAVRIKLIDFDKINLTETQLTKISEGKELKEKGWNIKDTKEGYLLEKIWQKYWL